MTPGPSEARKRRMRRGSAIFRAHGALRFDLEGVDVDLKLERMEEAEVPLENLHEEIHHRAEHGGEPWISWVALSTAILAVLAAIAGLLSGMHANEAMMSQIESSDQWAYYQAKGIKAAVLDAKMSLGGNCYRRRPIKGRAISGRAKGDSERSEGETKRSQIKFSSTRSPCARRDHVSDRDRYRCDLRSDQETSLLDCEFALWNCRLRFSRARILAH